MIRAVGDHEYTVECLLKTIRNPFSCFYIGFNAIFYLPFIAVSYIRTDEKHTKSSKVLRVMMKLAATIIQVLDLLSAVITIIVG